MAHPPLLPFGDSAVAPAAAYFLRFLSFFSSLRFFSLRLRRRRSLESLLSSLLSDELSELELSSNLDLAADAPPALVAFCTACGGGAIMPEYMPLVFTAPG